MKAEVKVQSVTHRGQMTYNRAEMKDEVRVQSNTRVRRCTIDQ